MSCGGTITPVFEPGHTWDKAISGENGSSRQEQGKAWGPTTC